MNHIRMIVTDLDRTLLRSDKTISAYTANVLCRCQDHGIKVVFATARPKRTVKHFLNDIKADAIILHNGAVVHIGDDVFCHCGIDHERTRHILLSISKDYPAATLSVEIDDVFYANFDVSSVWNYTKAVLTDFTDLPEKPADKIIVGVSSMDDIARYSDYLPNDLYMEMNDGQLGLIMHQDATKIRAVKILAEHYGHSLSEAVAFGDDFNDLEMIRGCGIGVAMENALDEVKFVADFICANNDNDGVAKWIEKHVLNQMPDIGLIGDEVRREAYIQTFS